MNIVDKSVQVVTRTDGAGIVKPICFFITDNDESVEVINVERLVRRDKEKIGGDYIYTFTCEIIKDNMKMLCDLRLNLSTNEWILYRV
ncbi:hypothetical protein [Clostridium beijerinckii]|uniref:Uncharacterized protein n=1 Tax=Clostridium beijerinckii TaxID=1520 RepID=A0AAE5EXL7_CLOBE|nr:hypothetical protein [Clostridium beijerinckii]NSB14589.1 hypothetical protein [Clostridium beijerinckii]OOM34494.1 hypothetical protein CLOBE_01090 [Clostridium beijerinckii]